MTQRGGENWWMRTAPRYPSGSGRAAVDTEPAGLLAMNDGKRRVWAKVLIAIAAVLFVLSTPCIFGSVLGLKGVLADVGQAENHQMGIQLLHYAAYPLGAGVLVLVAGLLVLRSRPK